MSVYCTGSAALWASINASRQQDFGFDAALMRVCNRAYVTTHTASLVFVQAHTCALRVARTRSLCRVPNSLLHLTQAVDALDVIPRRAQVGMCSACNLNSVELAVRTLPMQTLDRAELTRQAFDRPATSFCTLYLMRTFQRPGGMAILRNPYQFFTAILNEEIVLLLDYSLQQLLNDKLKVPCGSTYPSQLCAVQ